MAALPKLAMLGLMLGAVFFTTAQGFKCKVAGQGLTWNFVPGRDVAHFGIPTEQECREMCSEKSECKGYSWRYDNVVGWCYEFAELESIHVCEDCFSGTLPTRFIGNCDTDPDNIIDELSTASAEDCHKACTDTDGCMGYTFFDETTVFENFCFLYSECLEVKSCDGCSGGSLNCFSPLQCFDYLILDSERRNENYPGAYECDQMNRPNNKTSEDWQGAGYYRFLPPAGIGMATKSPGPHHCATNGVYYIAEESNVIDNMTVGDEVTVKVCGDGDGDPGDCDIYISIMVTKCPANYFVYKLQEMGCAQKYCGSLEP